MGLEDVSGHTHHITHYTDLRIFLSLSNCRCSDLVTWDEDDFYSRGEEDAYNSRDEVTSIIFSTVTPSFESDQPHLQKSVNRQDNLHLYHQTGSWWRLAKKKGFLWERFQIGPWRTFYEEIFPAVQSDSTDCTPWSIIPSWATFKLPFCNFSHSRSCIFVQVADFLLNDLTESETQKELSKWFAQVMFEK